MTATAIPITAKPGRTYDEDRAEAAQLYALERSNDPREQSRAEQALDSLRRRRSAREEDRLRRQGKTPSAVTRRDPVACLDEVYQRTAELLRDHEETGGVVIRRSDIAELGVRVAVSRMQGGLEEQCDARETGRRAWAAFMAGCGKPEVARQCRLIVIERKPFGRCVEALGWGVGGKQRDRLKAALCDGLDGAAAFLGVV